MGPIVTTDEVKILRMRLIDIYVKNQKHFLAKELESSDENKTQQLLEKVKSLDLLLKTSKEDIDG